MPPALYAELTPWYHLVDPPEDHAEEVACFLEAFARGIVGPAATLLELGSGAGHNACHLKAHFACTLTDISEPMLALSRARNPECEHVTGDMRTLRLERRFDAVLVHDGVTYMTTEPDLQAAIETAFVHTRPGGAAIFTPDDVADTFVDRTEVFEGDDGDRALRYLEWSWDPVPGDDKARTEYRCCYARAARCGRSTIGTRRDCSRERRGSGCSARRVSRSRAWAGRSAMARATRFPMPQTRGIPGVLIG